MKKAPAASDMRIEYVPIGEILKWPRNPRKHDAKSMDASIERFGFNDAPTIDEGSGHLVEGHGRIEALERRRAAGKAPPERVRVGDDGAWLVPVVRGVKFKNELEAEAYLLAHNKITETGGWDGAMLAAVLESARAGGLEGIGFGQEEVQKILAKHDPALVEFPEYDESAAEGVIVHSCPKCGHKFASGGE